MKKIVKNAILVDKNINRVGEVKIEDGKIVEIGENLSFDDSYEIIDAKGKTVMPAFVDLHVHFRDPGFTYKEDLKTGSLSALRGGYTTVNTMANTKPICGDLETYNDIMKRAKELDLVDINQIVAVTKNFDGKNLVDYSKFENAKFLSDDGKGVLSETTMYRAILEAKKYDKIIMIHAESELSPIDYRIAEDLMTLRDVYLAKRLDGRIHLCHVSTIDSLEAVRRGKKEGVKVTCEVTPHHIALWDNSYRVNPPIREKADVDALIDGIVDGTVDAIATDHAPHTAEDKANGSPGLVGLETAFAICNTKLVKERNIDIRTLSKVMSYGGANLMGIKKGLLKEGYLADLVIVDTDKKIVVDSSKFASKAKNTPFDKMELYGEVLMTIKAGEIKYKGEF